MRRGFASNSSSSHSLVRVPDPRTVQSRDPHDDREYGWEYFVLASEQEKAEYLTTQYTHVLRGEVPDAYLANVIPFLTGRPDIPLDGYVDHQSVLPGLPCAPGQDLPDWRFARAFFEYVTKTPELVIVGGNDNSDYDDERTGILGEHKQEETWAMLSRFFGQGNGLWCRYDEIARVWTLFRTDNGDKFHVSFDKSVDPGDYVKSHLPELVDVKITDYCDQGCAFCYQGSTKQGEHADIGHLYSIARALAELGVFEVALGGGEPTQHPDFLQILEIFRMAHIIPNFTTRNYALLTDQRDDFVEYLEYAGGVAFSIQSVNEVKRVAAAVKDLGWGCGNRIHLHYVLGSTTGKEYQAILEAVKASWLRVVLLGYKQTGRGATNKPRNLPGDWLEKAVELLGVEGRLGLDTAAASLAGKERLAAAGVDPRSYYMDEGKFSCYIDAVQQKIGASSYHLDTLENYSEAYNLAHHIRQVYQKW